MRLLIQRLSFVLGILCIATQAGAETNTIVPIDLATALRLAGAQNLDVQIARERLAEAKANRDSSQWQFFPWLSLGVSYRRHNDLVQNVEGNIINTDKESYYR